MKKGTLAEKMFSRGSALILVVVVASLLAIVGMMFVMVARIDKTATAALSDDRELRFAIDTVIAGISSELVLDSPGMAGQEYYDYAGSWIEIDPGPDATPGTEDDIRIQMSVDPWLASLEPDVDPNGTPLDGTDDFYYWRQISDVTGYLRDRQFATQFVKVDPPGAWQRVPEYSEIVLDANGLLYPNAADDGITSIELRGQWADADGDGILDSKWIELDELQWVDPDGAAGPGQGIHAANGVTTSKGKSIYAAIRIIDKSSMINVNTAYKFDPNDPNVVSQDIDGSSQMQINLDGLAVRPDDVNEIHFTQPLALSPARYDSNSPPARRTFQENMIWPLDRVPSNDNFVPFDISDELDLRYRYLIDSQAYTRLEYLWEYTVGGAVDDLLAVPYDGAKDRGFSDWTHRVPFPNDPNLDRRHLLTTYNVDRVIDPWGDKMLNVNRDHADIDVGEPNYLSAAFAARDLYDAMLAGVDPDPDVTPPDELTELKARFAQLAVNLVDFADEDPNVTFFEPNDPNIGALYFGFDAQPFITEVACDIDTYPETGRNYFAVELYNPFDCNVPLYEYELLVTDPHDCNDPTVIGFSETDVIPPRSCFVVSNFLRAFSIYVPSDPNAPRNLMQDSRLVLFGLYESPQNRDVPVVDIRNRPNKALPPIYTGNTWHRDLHLRRVVDVGEPSDPDLQWIYVDKQQIPAELFMPGNERHFGRDVRGWHVVYQTMEEFNIYRRTRIRSHGDLGRRNRSWNFAELYFDENDGHHFSFFLPNPLSPDAKLITIGDIPQILTVGPGIYCGQTIGRQLMQTSPDNEYLVRLDLENPRHSNIFRHLTVMDPADHGHDRDETRLKGRININTAPWYVIAQLPWVSEELAQAIVAYRDKLAIAPGLDYTGPAGRSEAVKGRIDPGYEPEDIREEPGFATIGELNFVIDSNDANDPNYTIARYASHFRSDGQDLPGYPDLTTDGLISGDGVTDDFEERDVIFSRISNLVTVRSDVFAAYILVRIGVDGPQKRAIAILDRSGVNSPTDQVKIIALHYVPDPR